jgi:hypothetical protein
MDKVRYIKILVLSLVSCSLAAGASADEQDFGLNVGVAVSKKFGKRFEIGLEEEMRTKENSRQLTVWLPGWMRRSSLCRKSLRWGWVTPLSPIMTKLKVSLGGIG